MILGHLKWYKKGFSSIFPLILSLWSFPSFCTNIKVWDRNDKKDISCQYRFKRYKVLPKVTQYCKQSTKVIFIAMSQGEFYRSIFGSLNYNWEILFTWFLIKLKRKSKKERKKKDLKSIIYLIYYVNFFIYLTLLYKN